MSWFDADPWLSEPLPPAPVGPTQQRPQPARPPAPLDQVRPPAPLDQTRPPAPLDQARPPAPQDQARPPAPLVRPPASIQNFHYPKAEHDSVTRGGVHAEGEKLCFYVFLEKNVHCT